MKLFPWLAIILIAAAVKKNTEVGTSSKLVYCCKKINIKK